MSGALGEMEARSGAGSVNNVRVVGAIDFGNGCNAIGVALFTLIEKVRAVIKPTVNQGAFKERAQQKKWMSLICFL